MFLLRNHFNFKAIRTVSVVDLPFGVVGIAIVANAPTFCAWVVSMLYTVCQVYLGIWRLLNKQFNLFLITTNVIAIPVPVTYQTLKS